MSIFSVYAMAASSIGRAFRTKFYAEMQMVIFNPSEESRAERATLNLW